MNSIGSALNQKLSFPRKFIFWSLCFIYSSIVSLLFQKTILPMLPEIHAGHGLLKNDAVIFHQMAVEIAQRIHSNGWSEWQLYPQGATANVSLLSALYTVLGPDPAWFIPFNAAAHATGALLIYSIGCLLVKGDEGQIGGLIAALCFLLFPTSLQWYGQNHKDSFAIAGTLLILYAWLKSHCEYFNLQTKELSTILSMLFIGVFLLGLVKPYYVAVVFLALFISFLIASIYSSNFKLILFRFIFIAIIATAAIGFSQVGPTEVLYGEKFNSYISTYMPGQTIFLWKQSTSIPLIFDKMLQKASELRAHFILFGRTVAANSEIDGNRQPDTALAAIMYMPRALQIGLFSPFPNTWIEKISMIRLIGSMETAFAYLIFLGSLVTINRHKSRKMIIGIVFCAVILTILAYIHPNVGTLYRQRYAIWQFFILIGCLGWASLLSNILISQSSLEPNKSNNSQINIQFDALSSKLDHLIRAGTLVAIISVTCYIGFFVRDIILTAEFGFSNQIDAFYSALMIAMFFVNCVAMPFGDAFIVPFVKEVYLNNNRHLILIRGALGLILVILVIVYILVFLASDWLASIFTSSLSREDHDIAVSMIRWLSLLIILSGWTIVGNAIINSRSKSVFAASAQLIVPAFTLFAMAISPINHKMQACIGGMLLGTLVNVIVVISYTYVLKLELLPDIRQFSVTAEIRKIFWPLFVAALAPAIATPMNYAFASSIGSGKVAAWSISTKILTLFSSLFSVLATSVLLPQMAHSLQIKNKINGNFYTQLVLFCGIWLGGVVMLACYIFSEPSLALIFGKKLSDGQITELTTIVNIGILQLPITILFIFISKMSIVSGKSTNIMYSSIISFAGNLILNIILSPKFGVTGVAIGSLSGAFLSLTFLIYFNAEHIGLSFRDIVIATGSWLSWIVICLGISTNIQITLLSGIVALILMARLQFSALRYG